MPPADAADRGGWGLDTSNRRTRSLRWSLWWLCLWSSMAFSQASTSPIDNLGPSYVASAARTSLVAVTFEHGVVLLATKADAGNDKEESVDTSKEWQDFGPTVLRIRESSPSASAQSHPWSRLGATALVGLTGLRADVDYVRQSLQASVAQHRLIYDDTVRDDTLLTVDSDACGPAELAELLYSAALARGGGRPLAVQGLWIRLCHSSTDPNDRICRLYSMDPTGTLLFWARGATAVGHKAGVLRDALAEAMKEAAKESASSSTEEASDAPERLDAPMIASDAVETAIKALSDVDLPSSMALQGHLLWFDNGRWRWGEIDPRLLVLKKAE